MSFAHSNTIDAASLHTQHNTTQQDKTRQSGKRQKIKQANNVPVPSMDASEAEALEGEGDATQREQVNSLHKVALPERVVIEVLGPVVHADGEALRHEQLNVHVIR